MQSRLPLVVMAAVLPEYWGEVPVTGLRHLKKAENIVIITVTVKNEILKIEQCKFHRNLNFKS